MTSTCNSCIYMHRNSDELGQCRRYAPRSSSNLGDQYPTFPWVNTLKDWCGDYSANFRPFNEAETQAFLDPLGRPALSAKPTPYHKDFTP